MVFRVESLFFSLSYLVETANVGRGVRRKQLVLGFLGLMFHRGNFWSTDFKMDAVYLTSAQLLLLLDDNGSEVQELVTECIAFV